MRGATRAIATFVVETPTASIPRETLDAVRRSCFDVIGDTLAGSMQPVGQIIQRQARARGGNPEATVLASGFRTSATEAAFTNGTMGHALDYDDFGSYGHPTVPLFPALLAGAELSGASGQDLLTAYAIGFEVGHCLYKDGNYNQYERGFHSTPVFGAIAAATGCSRLLGLSIEQTISALGIAASEASGIGRNNGTMTKPLHAGQAARAGITAALLAQDGLTAAPDIFEAKQGFCETFLGDNRFDLERIVNTLGNPYKPQSSLMIKKYPCCGGNHSALDAVLSLIHEHDITYDDIEQVEVQAMTYTSPVLRYPEPTNGLNAKFSIHHAVGAAIRDGEVTIEHFTDECARDSKMQEARAKVRAEVMPRWDPRFMYGDTHANPVLIRLKDGRTLTKSVGRDELKGSPRNPLSEEELVAKFRANARRALPDGETVDRAVEICLHLENVAHVSEIIDAVSGSRATVTV